MQIDSYYDQIKQATASLPSYMFLVFLCLGSLIGGGFLAIFLFKCVGARRIIAYPVSALAGTAVAVMVYLGSAPGLAAKAQEVQLLTRHLCHAYVDSARRGNIEVPPYPEEILANVSARNISMLCYRAGVPVQTLRSAFDSLVRADVITPVPEWRTTQKHAVAPPRSV